MKILHFLPPLRSAVPVVAIPVTFGLLVPIVSGDVLPVSFARSVRAQNFQNGGDNSNSSPLLGPWSFAVAADNVPGAPGYVPSNDFTVRAAQNSNIAESAVTFSGTGAITHFTPQGTNLGGQAESRGTAIFDVLIPQPYRLDTFFSFTGGATTFRDIYLRDDQNQTVFRYQVSPPPAVSGTLAPGRYTLQIIMQSNNSGPVIGAQMNYQISLTIPAPTTAAALALLALPLTRRRR